MQMHLQQLQTGCTELLRLLEEEAGDSSLVTSGAGDDPLSQLRRKILVEMVELRTMNWEAQESVNAIKETTSREKQSVDKIQLDIQNIYYQHKHLRNEIDRCEDFRSKHENIELVSLDEFYKTNPEARDIEDPHELMMARLQDEEQRRLDLFITKTRLTDKKNSLLHENKQRKEDMESLDENLQRFIEVRSQCTVVATTNILERGADTESFSKVLNIAIYIEVQISITPWIQFRPQLPLPRTGQAACGARPW